jgi:hypothetical protein
MIEEMLAWGPWVLIVAVYFLFFAWFVYLTILARRLVGAIERIARNKR